MVVHRGGRTLVLVILAALLASTMASTAPVGAQGTPRADTGLDIVAIDVAAPPDHFDTLTLMFNRAVDESTLTADDITVAGVAVLSVTPISTVAFEVALDGPAPAANYALTVGPDVTDTLGVAFDDDRDGTDGEAEDAFEALLVGADTTVAAAGAELTDLHVVVASTLTVDGPHLLDGLDVADGGVVTHTPFPAGGTGVDLDVRNRVRVLTGGAIDASERGRGIMPGTIRRPGSHGGEGSDASLTVWPQETYGDFRQPTEPGQAGSGDVAAGTGGGVVMVSAGDRIVVDGLITADADDLTSGNRNTPSGGSVLLGAPLIDGAGEVSADGGDGVYSGSLSGFGGGGRVALRGGDVADALVDASTACGGVLTVAGTFAAGGAGTVYVEESGSDQLIVDNCGLLDAADTPLSAGDDLVVEIDDVVVRDGGVLSLVDPLHAAALSITGGSKLTHPFTQLDGEHPSLRATVTGTMTVDATSSVDVSTRGLPLPAGSLAGASWPGSSIAGSYQAGGAYGGAADARDSNAPYGTAVFPNELGASAFGRTAFEGGSGGGLVQLVAGTLALDGAIRADGQAGRRYSCGPSCFSYTYGGAGGGVLVDAGTLSGAGSIAATGGDAGGDYEGDHGSGGRVAVHANTWAGFDPGAVTAPPGGVDRPSGTLAEAGSVVTTGTRRVGWTRPLDLTVVDDEVILHGTETLGWFAPAGTTADVTLTPTAGGPPVVLGVDLAVAALTFDTSTVPNGRYQLIVTASAAGGAEVGTDTRDVVVTNLAGVTWFDERHIDAATTLPGGVVLFEHDVTVASGVAVTVPANATYKFAPGVGVGLYPEQLTVEAGAVLTSWRDDSVVGDTNFDGTASSPDAGDWSGFRGSGENGTEGAAVIDPTASFRFDTFNLGGGNIPDGFVFETDRTYVLWPRKGSFDSYTTLGETIAIEPGAVLKGLFDASMDLDGRTDILATPDDPAILTSRHDDSVGGDLNRDRGYFAPAPGDLWAFQAADISPLQNFELRHLGGNGTAMTVTSPAGEDLQVDGLVVRDALGGQVSLNGTGVDVINSVVEDIPNGLQINGGAAASSVTNTTAVRGIKGVTLSGTGVLDITNTTISEFTATGITAAASKIAASYTNLWSEAPGAVDFSAAQTPGAGMLDVDPGFRDRLNGDLDLLAESPLVDAGNSDSAPPVDILGRPRFGPPDIGAYELQATVLELGISDVSPATAANIGPVTLTVDGSLFAAATEVRLERGATVLEAADVDLINSSRLTAQFDLTGAETGPWDLTVIDGADTATAVGAVTVVAGGQEGQLDVSLTVPEFGRDWIAMPAVVRYENTGDTDIDAPLIELTADGARYFSPGTTDVVDGPVELLSGSPTGSPDRLAPGEVGTVVVRYDIDDDLPSGTPAELSLHWYQTTDDTPYDWEARKDELRPDGVSDAVWDAAWPIFLDLVGGQYGAYAGRLGNQALQPESDGRTEVAVLLDLLVADALGYVPMISGTVLDADGAPAAGRIVVATALDPVAGFEEGEVASAVTDEDGQFALSGVPSGTYALTVSGSVLSELVSVAVGATPVEDVELELAAAGSIIGTATVGGAPTEGLDVRATHAGGRDVASLPTGADGSFTLGGLVPGPYEVVLSDEAGSRLAASVVDVDTDEPAEVDFAVADEVVIEGTVRVGGALTEGLEVLVTHVDSGASTTVETGGSGEYSTAGRPLPAGDYVVSARSNEGGDRATVTAPAGTSVVHLDIDGLATISGMVTGPGGTPLEGVSVRADGVGTGVPVVTDSDGTYEVPGEPGDRILFFELAGYQLLQEDLTVAPAGATLDVELDPVNTLTVSVVDGEGHPLAGVPIDVVPADGHAVGGLTNEAGLFILRNTTDAVHEVLLTSPLSHGAVLAREEVDVSSDMPIELLLEYGTVSGTITRDGAPVDGAYVALVRPAGEVASLVTDDDGTYQFSVLDGAAVDIVAVEGPDQVAARNVDVPVGADIEQDLAFGEDATVEVTARLAGVGVAGAAVSLVGADGDVQGATGVTDESGVVELDVSAGDHRLRVTPVDGAIDVRDVVVTAGAQGVVVDVAPAGSVVGSTGIAGARVAAVHESGLRMTAVADAAGDYEMPHVPVGEVELTAAVPGRPPMTPVDATVTEDTDTDIDLVVPAATSGVTLSGVVRDGSDPIAGARVAVVDGLGTEADFDLTGTDGAFEVLGSSTTTDLVARLGDARATTTVTLPGDPATGIDIELAQLGATANPIDLGTASPVGARSVRSDVDAIFADISRALDYRNFPPPQRIGPDMDEGFSQRWLDYNTIEDCPGLAERIADALARAHHMDSSFDRWQASADAASIETGADLGEVLSEGAIVGLETTKFLAELAEFYKPEGVGQAFKNPVNDMGSGAVENAKLSHLLKGSKLSTESLDNIDAEFSFMVGAMQDSMAKFQAGDWDGGMAVVNSINTSDINALKLIAANLEQAGHSLPGTGKVLEAMELIKKWKDFVEKQDQAFSDTGPASSYMAALDEYAAAVQDYQDALAALQELTKDCPRPPAPPVECPPDDPTCIPPLPPPPPEPPVPPGPDCPNCGDGPKGSFPRRPTDPNEIIGTSGVGEENWLGSLADLPYLVTFENKPDAEAAAVVVDVVVPLDDDADPGEVILGSLGWGGATGPVVEVPAGASTHTETVDIDGPAEVEVLAEFDDEANELHWRFEARDEETGELFVDGFLPPNALATHVGEGWVDFRLSGDAGLESGATLTEQATIVFDTEDPIATNTWTNRLDLTPPVAEVADLPATVTSTSFPVSWTGSDAESGIATFDVYVAVGDDPFSLWLDDTATTTANYPGADGVTYHFEAVATDQVGLSEAIAGVAEATTTVDAIVIPGGCHTTPFVDVLAGHVFCDDIAWLYDEGITTGTVLPGGDVVFKPGVTLTREAMAAFLYRYAGEPAVLSDVPHFADVPTSHPFFDEIQWMFESGNATGFDNPAGGKPLYRPARSMARQAMAAFLYRLAGEPTGTSGTPHFSDVGASHAFFEEIQWMFESGVSTGSLDPPGQPLYKPTTAVTRQAMAAFLHRFDDIP